MKILSVNNIQSRQDYKKNITPVQSRNFRFSDYKNNSFLYYGKDLLSFSKRTFEETLEENYFQLSKGCFPDDFQIEAGRSLNNGNNLIVEAPTGTGKTAIAHYITSKNLKEGKKTFYTTPLKALSNQKLNEFREIYSSENVGILTGDRHENIEAPIIIMTTEVYRNMAIKNDFGKKNPIMKNLGAVIFDELHYLGDYSRGGVWEEAVIHTPAEVQILGLSATISNSRDLQYWMNSLNNNNTDLVSVPAEKRYVPLVFDTITTKSYQKSENWFQKQLAKKGTINYDEIKHFTTKPDLNDFKTVINLLQNENQLPAIFFVFSKNLSKELLDYFGKENKSLTTEEEKLEIKNILEKSKKEKYIGEDLNEAALLNGYAIHNAGIIPAQKELIEELFQKKLIKVVIATETLAAGINMPAKTVVISSPYKPSDDNNTEENIRILSANEFKQMAGRAGRRGIDTKGYVYVLPANRTAEMDFLQLEIMNANPIESHYEPNYSFLCSFYENNTLPHNLKNIFEKSFYAYSDNAEESQLLVQKLIQDSLYKTDILKNREFVKEEDGLYSLTTKGKMASKVNGYNAILLIDLINSAKMSDIEPETLAMIAGAIASPVKINDIETDFNFDFKSSECISAYISDAEKLRKEEIHGDLSVKYEKPGKIGAKAAYYWVLMNKINPDSITNWKELNNILKDGAVDEGTIYKNILQCNDLLSQIEEITEIGIQNAKTEDEIKYHEHLKITAKRARELLIKEPISLY